MHLLLPEYHTVSPYKREYHFTDAYMKSKALPPRIFMKVKSAKEHYA